MNEPLSHLKEAIFKAAGWPLYCSDCNGPMEYAVNRAGHYFFCSQEECRKKHKAQELRQQFYWRDED